MASHVPTIQFMPRLYLSPEILDLALTGDEFDLDAEASKKIARVLRMSAGETFVGFSGFGREWECAISAIESDGKPRVKAVLLSERDVERLERVRISIAQAIPKGDKMDLVLQKGTEIGVAEFYPFDAERSVSRLDPDADYERSIARTQRYRKIVEGAAAQSGRADVPVVHAISDFSTAVATGTGEGACLMLDESDDALSLREVLKRDPIEWSDETPPRVMLLIGPEGGWSPREREWGERYGAVSVSLGSRILRTETAALVAATILKWEAGEI